MVTETANPITQPLNEGAKLIAPNRGTQKRLFPKLGDRDYVHLADLLLSIRKVATNDALTILDYGAGDAPYRSLFPHSQYFRADLATAPSEASGSLDALGRDEVYPEPDYVISADGRVPHESSAFDLILSTQVLEHVRDPEVYLAECFRLLKPGGRLFLSTHGSWPDHGCPYDFRRWTADGLKYDLQKTGFDILSVEKLTTGPRAVLWFLQRLYLATESPSRKTLFGLGHWLCRLVPPSWFHLQADRMYPDCRVVSADAPDHKIYLCVAVYAQRPL